MTPAELVKRLREAVGLSQETLALRSGDRLTRNDVNKIEAGKNQATTHRVRAGIGVACGVTLEEISDYLDGGLSLPELLARRAARSGNDAPASRRMPVLRNHPHWAQLTEEAKKIRRGLADADFERIADSPFLFGALESVDAVFLADLASDVADWAARVGEK